MGGEEGEEEGGRKRVESCSEVRSEELPVGGGGALPGFQNVGFAATDMVGGW